MVSMSMMQLNLFKPFDCLVEDSETEKRREKQKQGSSHTDCE